MDDQIVKVIATQVRVAVGRKHFDHAIADFQNRHVEGAAAKIEDGDLAALALVHVIGERCCGGLVDDAFDVQTSDFTRVFGCLTLTVVEVRRHGDDRFGHRLT